MFPKKTDQCQTNLLWETQKFLTQKQSLKNLTIFLLISEIMWNLKFLTLSMVEDYNYPLMCKNTPKKGVDLLFTPFVLFYTPRMLNFKLRARFFRNQFMRGV